MHRADGGQRIIELAGLDKDIVADGCKVKSGDDDKDERQRSCREKAHGFHARSLKCALCSKVGSAANERNGFADGCLDGNTHQQVFGVKFTAGLDGCAGKNGDHKNNERSVGDEAGDDAGE